MAVIVWGSQHTRVLPTGGSGGTQWHHCRARLHPCVLSLPACCGGWWGEHVLLGQSCAFPPGRLSWGSGALRSRLALPNGACNSLICWVLSEIDDLCVPLVVAQPWLTAHTFAADSGKWAPCTGACLPAPSSVPCRAAPPPAPFAGAASPSPLPGRWFRTVCAGCRSPCVGSLQQARILPQPAKLPWTSWVLSCRISQAAAARTVLALRGRVGVLVGICSCGIAARLQCAVAPGSARLCWAPRVPAPVLPLHSQPGAPLCAVPWCACSAREDAWLSCICTAPPPPVAALL